MGTGGSGDVRSRLPHGLALSASMAAIASAWESKIWFQSPLLLLNGLTVLTTAGADERPPCPPAVGSPSVWGFTRGGDGDADTDGLRERDLGGRIACLGLGLLGDAISKREIERRTASGVRNLTEGLRRILR